MFNTLTPQARRPSLIHEADLRERYFKHCKGVWPGFGEDGFSIPWGIFERYGPNSNALQAAGSTWSLPPVSRREAVGIALSGYCAPDEQ